MLNRATTLLRSQDRDNKGDESHKIVAAGLLDSECLCLIHVVMPEFEFSFLQAHQSNSAYVM